MCFQICTFVVDNSAICARFYAASKSLRNETSHIAALQSTIEQIDWNVKILCVGTFNGPKSYLMMTQTPTTSNPTHCCRLILCIESMVNNDLIHLFLRNDLHQVNHVRNFQAKTLDLIFYSDCAELTKREAAVPMVKIDAFHPPIEVEFTVQVNNVVEHNTGNHE